MKNALLGLISFIVILLAGFAINTSEGRTLRQNELDSSLSAAMQRSMEILMTSQKYEINDPVEFVADFIQGSMSKMNSESAYIVTIHDVDIEKGLLDASVTEEYKQFLKPGKVSARKTIIVEDYDNTSNESFIVTFKDKEDRIIKQLSVHGGDNLNAAMLPSEWKTEMFVCVESGVEYTKDSFSGVIVTSNMTFAIKTEGTGQPEAYSIIYRANDGSNTEHTQMVMPNSGWYVRGAIFHRKGYTLESWNTSSSGNGERYELDEFKLILNKNLTLYAQWKPQTSDNTYFVHYNSNGGFGQMENSVHVINESSKLRSNQFNRNGYEFLGWSTDKNAIIPMYNDQHNVYNLTTAIGSTVELYAIWEEVVPMSHIITYKPNGGTGSDHIQNVEAGNGYYLRGPIFSKTGYVLESWNTEPDGNGQRYEIDAWESQLSKDLVLYAIWKRK